jgi:hypothetical protein
MDSDLIDIGVSVSEEIIFDLVDGDAIFLYLFLFEVDVMSNIGVSYCVELLFFLLVLYDDSHDKLPNIYTDLLKHFGW